MSTNGSRLGCSSSLPELTFPATLGGIRGGMLAAETQKTMLFYEGIGKWFILTGHPAFYPLTLKPDLRDRSTPWACFPMAAGDRHVSLG